MDWGNISSKTRKWTCIDLNIHDLEVAFILFMCKRENKSEEKKKMKDEGRSPWIHADFRHNYDMMKAETWKWAPHLSPAPHLLSLSLFLSSGQQVVKLRSKQELKQVNKTKSAMLTCCEDERWLYKCTKKSCLCSQSVF